MRASSVNLIRILPRKAVPKASTLTRPQPEIKVAPYTLIRELVDQQAAMGDSWPPNLRIETFENKRQDWVGVNKHVRKSLKKFIQEK